MYVTKSGILIEDQLKRDFDILWAVYTEKCGSDRISFMTLIMEEGNRTFEQAEEIVDKLIEARDIL